LARIGVARVGGRVNENSVVFANDADAAQSPAKAVGVVREVHKCDAYFNRRLDVARDIVQGGRGDSVCALNLEPDD
jgi:hypothetical protein